MASNGSHLPVNQLYELTSMVDISERGLFTLSNAMVFVIIRDIGSGKSVQGNLLLSGIRSAIYLRNTIRFFTSSADHGVLLNY